jgi:hypothetical protein
MPFKRLTSNLNQSSSEDGHGYEMSSLPLLIHFIEYGSLWRTPRLAALLLLLLLFLV